LYIITKNSRKDRFYNDIDTTYIVTDNYDVSSRAIEFILEEGYKGIAMICYDIHMFALTERKKGCFDVLKNSKKIKNGKA
jgi:DNA-binding LacI/PurR family transcriptional regulator